MGSTTAGLAGRHGSLPEDRAKRKNRAAIATLTHVIIKRCVWLLGLALALTACAEDTPLESSAGTSISVSRKEIVAISILSPTAWWLRIDTDGSGQVGYGSAFQDTVAFSAGTFRLGELSDRLMATCITEGTLDRDTAVTFVAAMGRSAESLYCSDPKLVVPIFDRAVEEANLSGTRLRELYDAQPPVPM